MTDKPRTTEFVPKWARDGNHYSMDDMPLAGIEPELEPSDLVNHPAHYTQGGIECIDAIEAALGNDGFIAFLQGQVIKYAWRMQHKGAAAQDAAKLKFYADKLAEGNKASK